MLAKKNDKIIEANLYELCENVALLGKFPVQSIDGFNSVHQPSLAWPDIAYRILGQSISASDIINLQEKMMAFSWSRVLILNSELLTKEVQNALRINGFGPVAIWSNMSISIQDIPLEINKNVKAPNSIEVREVRDRTSLAVWTSIVEKSLFPGKGLDQELFFAGIEKGLFSLLIGYYEGEAASTLMLYKGSSAGAYMVATDSRFRRKGIARRLMAGMFEIAVSNQYTDVVLHSTKEGVPFYKSLGFEVFGSMVLFYKK